MTIKTETKKTSKQIAFFILIILVLGILFKMFYFTYWNLFYEFGGLYLIKGSFVFFWLDVLLPGIALIFATATLVLLYILHKQRRHKIKLLIVAIHALIFIYFLNDWFLFF